MKITIKTSELEVNAEYPVAEIDMIYYDSRTSNFIRITSDLVKECTEKTIAIIKAKNHE